MKTPDDIIKGQLIRYVDSYQVGDGAATLTTAILAALRERYRIELRNPCRCGCGLTADEHLCPCGCGHTYTEAVQRVMSSPMCLNWEQASANIDEYQHVPCKWSS